MEKNSQNGLHFANEADRWHDDLLNVLKIQKVKRRKLAELLGYTMDAIGRRLRGDTPWSLADYGLLTQYFDLAPIGQRGNLRFEDVRNPDLESGFSPDHYLSTLKQLATVCETGNYSLDVMSSDLPIFYFLDSPTLIKLKLLLFTANASPRLVRKAQQRNLHHFKTYVSAAQEIGQRYLRIERREMWGPDPLRSFLHQIERLAISGQLNEVDLQAVAAAVSQLSEKLGMYIYGGEMDNLQVRREQERAVSATYLFRKPKSSALAFVSLDNPYFVKNADGYTGQVLSENFDRHWSKAAIVSGQQGAAMAYRDDLEKSTERRMKRLVSIQKG
jgi:hypothetical protein